MTAWAAVLIVVAATLVGIIGTVVTKHDPGVLLGIAVIAGAVIAAIGVRYSSAYLLVPAPTLAYVLGAMASGYVHDRSVDTSHTELALHAAEWVGAGFLWMSAGTIAALVIAIGRWLWARRDLWLSRGGRRPAPAGAGAGPAGAGPAGAGPGAGDPRLRERETARPPRPGFTPAPSAAPPAPAFTPKAKTGTYPRSGAPSPTARPPASDAPRGAAEPRRPRPSSTQDGRYYDDETWR
ncbi:MAG: DUF6542 domain-containing protein [Streptosporangiaceae bacterium]|jgi:hypothetical protein